MIRHYWIRFLAKLNHAKKYIKLFLKWTVFAGIIGVLGGIVGMFFHLSVDWATETRIENPNLIYGLPIAGLIIVFLYKKFGNVKNNSTDAVVKSARRDGRKLPIVMAPLIFVATFLTHLCGGSAGREGAALQLGGAIGSGVGTAFKAKKKETPVFIICGMSALFSALFGTPLTAVFFAMEVSYVGIMRYSALLPCTIASFVAVMVTHFSKIPGTAFKLANQPTITLWNVVSTIIISILVAMVSILFCKMIKNSEKIMHRIKNEYLRIIVGALILILLTFILNTRDYNGAGMDIITMAVEEGRVNPLAFLLKMIFTVITISVGFKGGEIVPTLFIGSTFGCFFAGLLGMDAGLGAAIGMTGMFCGMLNSPIASIFLSIELFGGQGLILFVVSAIISYAFSGYYGLYSTQKILSSKLGMEFVSLHTKK